MVKNRGKDFEDIIKTCLQNVDDFSIDRLPDQMSGFHASSNISDFTAYQYPFQYFLECKSTHETTLNFSNITDAQYQGMLEKSKNKGVLAGIIVWFIDKDLTFFVDIQAIRDMKEQGLKSINPKNLVQGENSVRVWGNKKRVYFEYDGLGLSKDLTALARKKWGV